MSIETEIQTEVDALKARFDDTKSLYREVCALLFFRYGITPTANKLYQFVRKGSMSAPSDALAKFWDELRSKARVEIDHPDLPDEVKEAAASAIAAIWRQASAAAREELHDVREEAANQAATAAAEAAAAKAQVEELRLTKTSLLSDVDAGKAAAAAVQSDLEHERRAHAATSARLLELQRTCDDLRAQQQRLQDGFSTDLAKAQAAVDTANERADTSERRSLLEVDQERQARGRAEKALDSVRAHAVQTEERLRTEVQSSIEASARQAAKIEALEASNRLLGADVQKAVESEEALRRQLRDAEGVAARATAEAATLQGVLERLTPSGHTSLQTPRTSKNRKT